MYIRYWKEPLSPIGAIEGPELFHSWSQLPALTGRGFSATEPSHVSPSSTLVYWRPSRFVNGKREGGGSKMAAGKCFLTLGP